MRREAGVARLGRLRQLAGRAARQQAPGGRRRARGQAVQQRQRLGEGGGVGRKGPRGDGGRVVAHHVRERQHPGRHLRAGAEAAALEGRQVLADGVELRDAGAGPRHGAWWPRASPRASGPAAGRTASAEPPPDSSTSSRSGGRRSATKSRHGLPGLQAALRREPGDRPPAGERPAADAPAAGRCSGGATTRPPAMAAPGPSARSRPSTMGPATLPRASTWVGQGARRAGQRPLAPAAPPSMRSATSRKISRAAARAGSRGSTRDWRARQRASRRGRVPGLAAPTAPTSATHRRTKATAASASDSCFWMRAGGEAVTDLDVHPVDQQGRSPHLPQRAWSSARSAG